MSKDQVDVEVELDEGDWGTIETHKAEETKPVEYEVVDEEDNTAEVEAKPTKSEETTKVEETPEKEERPKELEGIKTRGAEKRIKQLVKQRKEAEERSKSLEARVSEYEARLKAQQDELVNVQKTNLDSTESQLTNQLSHITTSYKKALENGDTSEIVQLQTTLNDTQIKLNALQASKKAYDDYVVGQKSTVAVEQPQQQQRPYAPNPQEFDPKAVAWASENEWFGQDKLMTQVALALNESLLQEGFEPNDDDFYEELEERLERALPKQFTKKNAKTETTPKEEVEQPEPVDVKASKKPSQVVGGSSRTSPNPSPNRNVKMKLTKKDVETAKKWNISLERYAMQKLEAEQANGEYTTINIAKRGG